MAGETIPDKLKLPEKKDALEQKKTSEDIKQEGVEARDNLKYEVFLSKLNKNDRADIKKILKLDSDLTPEKLAQISTMDLLKAEKEKNGSLMLLFGEKIEKEGKERRTFGYKEFEGKKFDKSVNVGDKIYVDFKGNKDAYWNIGAGDMLPETARQITIIDDKGNSRTSTMRQGLRGGFFDSAGYMPVFDGYTIVVDKVWSDTELEDYKKNLKAREKEELDYLKDIYEKNPDASRGKMQKLKDVFEKPDLGRLNETMDKAMADLGVGPEFKPVLYSFIKHESGFKMGASPGTSSAYGLFQLLKSNWEWTYRDLARNPKFAGVSYDEFRNTLEGQVYSGILYFKKMDLKPVEQALGRPVDPNNTRDNYLLYVAHHEGPGGLRHYLRTGNFKSGVPIIGGYAWKVANGAEFYRQELERMAALKNAPAEKQTVAQIFPHAIIEDDVKKELAQTVLSSISPTSSPEEIALAKAIALPEIPQTPLDKTAFMGDSLTKGMEMYAGKEIEGAGAFGIGGQNTGQMLKRFKREVVDGGYKKVVILAGVNNLGSNWTPEKTERDLEKMYKMAKEAGIKVVACTLPPWGKFMKNHAYKKFAVERGLTAEKMQSATEQLNNWIRSQEGGLVDKVVDLYKYMGDEADPTFQKREFAAGDGLHQTGRGSISMLEIIKDKARIG
ncbi:hypothetical protein HZA39_04525 [Candidatus Peregrinibacteria bacterium]|nr:hypothetical protein [Candidatus Peregrinibacteria bacterium]